jgi:bacillithiol system protein YtxJ
MKAEWHHLLASQQLDNAIELSFEKPVVVFKHSTRCGTSLHILSNITADWHKLEHEIEFYYLDLLQHRDISNRIAAELNVVHQSPQIILIKNGKAVYHTSHFAISINDLNKALQKHLPNT